MSKNKNKDKNKESLKELGLETEVVTEQKELFDTPTELGTAPATPVEEVQEQIETVTQEQPELFDESKETETETEVVTEEVPAVQTKRENRFRRMKPNLHEKPKTKTKEPLQYGTRRRKEKKGSSNPTMLAFPTDKWGITKDIKKAFIEAASRVAGDEQKKALVLATVDVLLEHLDAKFDRDFTYKQQLLNK